MNEITTYQPRNFGELETFCKRVCASGMVGPAYRNKPDDAAVAIMFGAELGLPPMTSLQFIAVINGKPGLHSDAMPGLALSKGMIIDMQEHFEGEFPNDNFTAVCELTRPSGSVVEQRFSIGDAKRAGLWDKVGPWKQYPKRMLQWRARSWGVRDAAPQLMFGPSSEELGDIETARGPDKARDITPKEQAPSPRAAVTKALEEAPSVAENGEDHEPPLFEELDDPDPCKIEGLGLKQAILTLEMAIEAADDRAAADRLLTIYREKVERANHGAYASLAKLVAEKIEAGARL